jgi:folylpolyglutamate synthase/dihydropteroate synthase
VGIGADKDAELMFKNLLELKNLKLYLTETPFKGRKIQDYPPEALSMATASSENPFEMMEVVKAEAKPGDLCVVTGSLYLVGEILKKFTSK